MAPSIQRFASLKRFRLTNNYNHNNHHNNKSTSTSTSTTTTPTATPPPQLTNTVTKEEGEEALIAMRYEDMDPNLKLPIPVTVAPPLSPPTDTHPAFRPRSSSSPSSSPIVHELEEAPLSKDATKRDSGLAPTTTTTSTTTATTTTTAHTSTSTIPPQNRKGDPGGSIVNIVNTDNGNVNVLGININFDSKLIMANPDTSSTPQTQLSHAQSPASHYNNISSVMKNETLTSSTGSLRRWRTKNSNAKTPTGTGKSTEIPEEDFTPITTPIPGESLLEDDFMQSMSFSKRGSMMLSGRKAVNGQARFNATRRWVGLKPRSVPIINYADERHSLIRQPSFSMLATTSSSPKVLSDDLEMESQKVRSMYESGSGFDWRDGEDDSIDHRVTAGGESIPERPVT